MSCLGRRRFRDCFIETRERGSLKERIKANRAGAERSKMDSFEWRYFLNGLISKYVHITSAKSRKTLNTIRIKNLGQEKQKVFHRRCSIKKMFLKIAKFTGKHLCWSLFLIKLQTWRLRYRCSDDFRSNRSPATLGQKEK